jgi:peroxiredoxin
MGFSPAVKSGVVFAFTLLMKLLWIVLLTNLFTVAALAQGYQVGSKVADFSLKDAGSNRNVALADYKNERAVVVVFTNNFCPYSKLYESRLISLSRQYSNGVKFVFINPTINIQEGVETMETMAAKAKEWNNQMPYLADEGQKVSSQFGASKTPEVFVLERTGAEFTVKYRGAIDDNPQVESNVKERYLKDALDSVMGGRAVPSTDKRPTGCMIKKS